ncbi:MAG: hypothetical protein HFJ28_00085 [Clostridia bacterium]|nr:hypothetical protein [Clostridia bacterium]
MDKKLYPLSNPQKSIWLTEAFGANTNLNNVGGYVFIKELVHFSCLEKAIQTFIEKNEAVRFHVTLSNKETPMQYIEDYHLVPISKTCLANIEEVEKWNYSIIQTPLNIIDSNLYHFELFSLPNGFGGFNITLHHLITDAWSMSLAISQIIDNYAKFIHQEEISYVTPNYTDFLISEEKYLSSNKYLKDEEFWNTTFDTTPELCKISSKKITSINTIAQRKEFILEVDLYTKINEFCKEHKVSNYAFFLAIYSIYLAKFNNSTTSIIGTPILNRANFAEKHTSRYVY